MSDTSNADHSAPSAKAENPERNAPASPTTGFPPSRGRADGKSRTPLRIVLVEVAVACVAALGAGAWRIATLGPAPLGKDIAFSTRVVDREGRLLRAYATPEGRWRLPAGVADVDPRFFAMLFAYEDKRFRAHRGVDPLALLRATMQLVTSGRIQSGGSTLTMQVARLLEPRSNRNVAAKLRQIVRAVEIERALSKDDILTLYLDLAPYGGNIEGHPRCLAHLFPQGAAAADACGSGSARGATAIAGSPKAGPLGDSSARRARSRARSLRQSGGVPADEIALPKPNRAGRPPTDADAGATCGGSCGCRCGGDARQRSTAHDRRRIAEEPGRACARAHALAHGNARPRHLARDAGRR